MPCIVIERPGGYDRLRLVDAPEHPPGAGQVALRVAAAGVNYADGIIRMGLYESAKRLHGYPITPGFEVAGTITAVGAGVDPRRVGTSVYALTLFGGYTSYLVLPEQNVWPLPPGIDPIAAAGIPTVFLTAWYMVHTQIHPRVGDRWLVHSAAGGVGQALCQLGRLAGVRVIGVVGGTDKIEAAQAAGCAEVIDKSRRDLWSTARRLAPQGYQAIFDANGVATLAASYRHLAPTGKLAVYGFASMLPRDGRIRWLRLAWDWWRTPRFDPLRMTRDNKSVLACNLSFLEQRAELLREGMDWLHARFGAGELRPLPVRTYPLAEAARAQRALESGRTTGKLVLLP